MIRRTPADSDALKVTFAVPVEVGPVSVVGDFNAWDPESTPLKTRSNGTRSAVLRLPLGGCYRFRYLATDGRFFDDESADAYEANGYGDTHGLLLT
jgi:1,4-alpha-glucan branching enzyme